jgi:hypothetical protein
MRRKQMKASTENLVTRPLGANGSFTPATALAEAKAVPRRTGKNTPLSAYVPAIVELRKSGYTWDQIMKWFAERGVVHSRSHYFALWAKHNPERKHAT